MEYYRPEKRHCGSKDQNLESDGEEFDVLTVVDEQSDVPMMDGEYEIENVNEESVAEQSDVPILDGNYEDVCELIVAALAEQLAFLKAANKELDDSTLIIEQVQKDLSLVAEQRRRKAKEFEALLLKSLTEVHEEKRQEAQQLFKLKEDLEETKSEVRKLKLCLERKSDESESANAAAHRDVDGTGLSTTVTEIDWIERETHKMLYAGYVSDEDLAKKKKKDHEDRLLLESNVVKNLLASKAAS